MIDFDNVTEKNTITHNPKQSYIADHSSRMSVIVAQDQEKQMQCLI